MKGVTLIVTNYSVRSVRPSWLKLVPPFQPSIHSTLQSSKGMTLSVLYICAAWVPYFLNKSYVEKMTFDQDNKIFVASTKNLWMRKKLVEFT